MFQMDDVESDISEEIDEEIEEEYYSDDFDNETNERTTNKDDNSVITPHKSGDAAESPTLLPLQQNLTAEKSSDSGSSQYYSGDFER